MRAISAVLVTALAAVAPAVCLWAAPGDLPGAGTVGTLGSRHPAAQTVYECWKTEEEITIDGKLDEAVWRRLPSMPMVGITDASPPPFATETRMFWDERYLYVGFNLEEPDIRAFWAFDEANCPAELVEVLPRLHRRVLSPEPTPWDYTECAIMLLDRFIEVFLDPDGDGTNYLELHCNALNNRFDTWYKQGYVDGGDRYIRRQNYPSVDWKCPGLLSATWIDGSVNAPHDIDRGWSLEMAIPWSSLAPFTRGACPPAAGDVWGALLCRVYRDRVGGPNEYWTWPFLGISSCHLPNRYGKLVFRDDPRRF